MSHHRELPSLVVIGLLPLALAACNHPTSSIDPRTQTPLVRVAAVQTSAQAERSFTGIVGARVQSDLGFRVPGKVLERLVDAGQPVKHGQPLMRIDPTDLRLAMHAHEEAVVAAKARAHQAAEDEVRHRNLLGPRAVSVSEYDKAKAAADSARPSPSRSRTAGPPRRYRYRSVRFSIPARVPACGWSKGTRLGSPGVQCTSPASVTKRLRSSVNS